MQLDSYLERGPLMLMMPLQLHINNKSDYDDDLNKYKANRVDADQTAPIGIV